MGTKKQKIVRVVLDTNILVSTLLFKGELAVFHTHWRKKRIIPLFSRDTFQEFQRVLSYPKFKLSVDDITFLLQEEVIPYFEVVDIQNDIRGVCSDHDDDKFLSCALSGHAAYIITGDRALLSVSSFENIQIITPAEFIIIQHKFK